MKKFLPGLICSVLLTLAPQLTASSISDSTATGPSEHLSEEGASSDPEVMEFRNPAIQLVPCALNKLRMHGPMEKPALCKRDLQRLLVQVGQSPCKVRPALCEDWVDRRGGQIEVSCQHSSREIAAAIVSCLR